MSKKFLYIDDIAVVPVEAYGFETSDFVTTSTPNAPIILDVNGLIADNMINVSGIDHGLLSGLNDDDHTIYSLADGSRNYSAVVSYASHPAFSSDKQIVDKKYVDDIALTSEWFPLSALDYVTDNTLTPATENLNDVYVLSHDGGVPNAAYDGASAGDIVKFNGTTWEATTPTTGTKVSVDNEPNVAYYLFGGVSWEDKLLESSTASTGLIKVGQDIRIDASAAGDGLGFTTGVLNVNVDGSSIETNLDALRVKALGINNSMLAGNITDDKLVEDYIKTSEVDNTTIEFGTSLNVKANGINDTHIDFGLGLNQVNGADIPLNDAGGFFTTDDVESALQELGSAVITRGVTYTAGTGGVSKGDLVFISGNDSAATYSSITTGTRAIGIASATIAAGNDVVVLSNDTVATNVISGGVAGVTYFWDGSSLVTTIPNGSGAYVWQAGIAKNATDIHVEVKLIKRNV